jgi:hypothetical protein
MRGEPGSVVSRLVVRVFPCMAAGCSMTAWSGFHNHTGFGDDPLATTTTRENVAYKDICLCAYRTDLLFNQEDPERFSMHDPVYCKRRIGHSSLQ